MAATAAAPPAAATGQQEVRQTSFVGKASTSNGPVGESRLQHQQSHESEAGDHRHQLHKHQPDVDCRPQRRHVVLHRHPETGFGFVAGSDKPVVVRFVKEGELLFLSVHICFLFPCHLVSHRTANRICSPGFLNTSQACVCVCVHV